ncbi:hypothetical protein LMG26411_08020 [Cupriavidus numazuensis]|uniref:Uncharacterized protein n=1 Tax=Cupriavidus numazuensis TaxID=221992 RepID=A0ABN7QC59_9BURK|nr:hypothetical protein LMG26411_08020 [Cupriavidus numazuensis]
MVADPSGLYSGVQCKYVGLECDLNELQNLRYRVGVLVEVVHFSCETLCNRASMGDGLQCRRGHVATLSSFILGEFDIGKHERLTLYQIDVGRRQLLHFLVLAVCFHKNGVCVDTWVV